MTIVRNANGCHGSESTKCGGAVLISCLFYGKISLSITKNVRCAQNGEKMRTYLVTGGAGFIGSNYIHYMFKKYDNEIRIINVDALTYAGNLENLKDVEKRENYTFVKANICDKDAISKIFA